MTAARAVTATFARVADLRVSALSAPATVKTGQTLAVANTVTNGGTLVLSGGLPSFVAPAMKSTIAP